MTRTPTLPITDRSMWQRLLSRAHPDAGGDHELFIWTGAVRDLVCSLRDRGGLSEPDDLHTSRHACPTHEEPARVPWDSGDDFEECTRTALRMGAVGDYYRQVLSLLADCYPLDHLAYEQERGASYKRLAAIAHVWDMTRKERIGWYRVAEDIPLSDRHAGHILARLKRRAA